MPRLFVIAFAIGLYLCLSSSAFAAERPNVIVVMTDDQGYGDLSCHGNPVVRTPNLDRLHDESVRLTDFHVAPMCTPTRSQLMTGVDALRNKAMGVSSGRALLRRDLPTMANIFADSGYRTGIFGKWHLGDNYPYRPQDRGFHEAIWFPSSHIGSVPDYWQNDYFDDTYFHGAERKKFEGYSTDVFFREAMSWMTNRAEAGEPFFTYLALNAPHGPLYVPDKYRAAVSESLEKALPQLPKLEPNAKKALVSFLAMIVNIDENMGRLENFLKDHNLRDNTIVVFLTDNGSTMGQRYYNAGMRGSKTTLWEGGHRVPCFVRWPAGNLRSPGDVKELTQVQDILPTLVELCGLKKPEKVWFDGVSLAKLLRGEADELPDRMLFINYSRMPWSTRRATPDSAAIVRRGEGAVLWKRWRLVQDKELYNIDDDPEQKHNVLKEHPKIAARMRVGYGTWWETLKDEINIPERVIIGHEAEPESTLTACEWYDVIVDQQRQVRIGDNRNGAWHLEVAAPGTYRFELRRWPREADLPLHAASKPARLTDGELAAGNALPIAEARIRIGDQTQTRPVTATDRAITFEAPLAAGPIDVETFFNDANGEELCGAYYLYVKRK